MIEREEDPERLADELEHGADRLEQHSRELGEDIERAREDWQRKRQDGGVPGAVPQAEEDSDAEKAGADPPPPEVSDGE